jgi:predicted Fe-Mo cluster-binding NifX family protein
MKIAVPFEDGQVFQHFGRSAQFKFYEAENGQLLRTEVIPTNGQGHGALAGFLVQHGADVLLCGGIGTGAQAALMQAGIQLFGGLSGDADAAVADYLAGKLVFRTSTAPTTTTTRATAAVPTAGAGATDSISKAALRADPECGFAI